MRALAVALMTAGMYLLVGCGGQQQEQKTEEQKTEQAPTSEPAPAPETQPQAADTAAQQRQQ